MLRVSTFQTNATLTTRLMDIETRLKSEQIQVSTGKKSQDYTGIASDALRLLNFHNQRTQAQSFINDNTTAKLRLDVEDTSVKGIDAEIRAFRTALTDFSTRDLSSQSQDVTTAIKDIQERAFNSLKDMEAKLNVRIDGRYLFSGGKVDAQPVNVKYGSLQAFQDAYPGTNGANYAVSRAQHMSNASLSATNYNAVTFASTGGNTGTITADPQITAATGGGTAGTTGYGNLTFNRSLGTITLPAANFAAFDQVDVGAQVTLTGTANGNDATYTITGKDSTTGTLTVYPPPAANEGPTNTVTVAPHVFSHLPIGSTITVSGSNSNDQTYTITGIGGNGNQLIVSGTAPVIAEGPGSGPTGALKLDSSTPNTYYQGDQLVLQHRVDDRQTIPLGINASDSAFEKAMRAMAVIAQGNLAGDPSRVKFAINLLNDSLEHDTRAMPQEQASSLIDVQHTIGRNQVLIADGSKRQEEFMGFLDVRIGGLENVNVTEAVTRLNSDATALDMAMKALAKIQQLSLVQYI